MATGNLTNWTANRDYDQVVAGAYESTVYYNKDGERLFKGIFPVEQSDGDSAYRWPVKTGGNTAEIVTEGAPAGVPTAITQLQAALSYVIFRATTSVSGHVRRALRGQAVRTINTLQRNVEDIIEALSDLQVTTFLGATSNGLQIAIDSAGVYAGIDRAAVAAWGSYEAAVGGALTYAAVDDMREGIRDNERGGAMDLLVMPHNQLTNLQRLIGTPGQANAGQRFALTQDGGRIQIAPLESETYFGAARAVAVGDLTDTVVCGLTARDWQFVEHPSPVGLGPNGLMEARSSISGQDDVTEYSVAGTLVCLNPKRQGKLTGVTA